MGLWLVLCPPQGPVGQVSSHLLRTYYVQKMGTHTVDGDSHPAWTSLLNYRPMPPMPSATSPCGRPLGPLPQRSPPETYPPTTSSPSQVRAPPLSMHLLRPRSPANTPDASPPFLSSLSPRAPPLFNPSANIPGSAFKIYQQFDHVRCHCMRVTASSWVSCFSLGPLASILGAAARVILLELRSNSVLLSPEPCNGSVRVKAESCVCPLLDPSQFPSPSHHSLTSLHFFQHLVYIPTTGPLHLLSLFQVCAFLGCLYHFLLCFREVVS